MLFALDCCGISICNTGLVVCISRLFIDTVRHKEETLTYPHSDILISLGLGIFY